MKYITRILHLGVPALLALTLTIVFGAIEARAQTTTFTYQGRLSDTSAAANGTYDFQFALYDAAAGGTQIGTARVRGAVNVTNGVFTVQLDFGAAAFSGADRFLQIAVKRSGEANFTLLTPRQQITSTPYAIRSLNATNADTATTATTATNAQQLGGTAASNFTQNDSTAFIRNQTTQQTADFNINGTGAANFFDAGVQYNIAGNRILSSAGNNNLFAGVSAGSANTTGGSNSFFGTFAGFNNTTGGGNSFVGRSAGQDNTTGGSNSFFGSSAGQANTTGNNNSFVGTAAGFNNTTGGNNSFFGIFAGQANTTGANNTIVGQGANLGSGALTFATALGSGAFVSTSNTIALGRSNGSDKVVVYGLGAADNNTTLCRNSLNQIAACNGVAFAKPENTDALKSQIEAQQKQINEQKALIDALRRLVCADKPNADVCKLENK